MRHRVTGACFLLLGFAACAADPGGLAPTAHGTPAAATRAAPRAEDLYVVDCLLPGQIRKLGRFMTLLAPRRAVKTPARDCETRGGEYVASDRADYATALRVWLPLAEAGDRTAQVYVGEIYEKGLGVGPDYALAAAWYRRAAEQGDARAQIDLGHLYEKGLGMERDLQKALQWYRRASGLGEAMSLEAAGLEQTAREREELASLRAEIERRNRETEVLRAQAERAQQELTQARQELDRRQREVEVERRRLAEAQRDLESAIRQGQAEREATAAEQIAGVRRLEEELSQRQAELTREHEEAARLRQRVTGLEGEAERQRERLGALREARPVLAGPTIEIIEPALVATRGVAVVRAPLNGGAPEQAVVGRVVAPAGLLVLTVNGREEAVESGLFRSTVAVSPGGTLVSVVAVDRQGKRESLEFRLARGEAAPPPPPASRPRPNLQLGSYHALVIGNQDYAHWPRLKTSEADALRTAELLSRRYGFKTRVLLNAGRFAILQALNELRAQLTEQDALLIYYAGHGYLDEKINRTYWIPVDGQLDSNVEWIPTIAVTDLVSVIPARHVMLVVDSCYSGALTRSALARLEAGMSEEARVHWLEVLASKRSRTVLASGDVRPVLDTGGGPHSVFARAWLDILGQNEEILEGQRLYREIAARVSYAAEALQFEQVPQYAPIRYAGHESGDFLFVPR